MNRYIFSIGINMQSTAGSNLRLAGFFIISFLILFSGCARQLRQPTPSGPPGGAPNIRVALDDDLNSGTLFFKGKYKLKSEEADYFLDETVGQFTVNFSNDELTFRSERRRFAYRNFKSIEFFPMDQAVFLWNDVAYPGKISFIRDDDHLLVVNETAFTEYLKGVVPQEMPSHTEDYYQALLAQAVAARTYALYHMEHPTSAYFDVYNDSRDQFYRGKDGRSELSDKAVEETLGLALVNSQNKLIETQYHSTCGGILELREDYQDSIKHEVLKDLYQDHFNCTGSPLFRWVKKVDTRRILDNLIQLGRVNENEADRLRENGFSAAVNIASRLPSGRVKNLTIYINDREYNFRGFQIRSVLAELDGIGLPSRLFFLKKSRKQEDLFYIVGAGYGHGKGMCQWGAIGLSLNEQSFRKILNHYYPGLSLTKYY